MSRAPLWVFADQLGRHVHGGEHADGGRIATKAYTSGGASINWMSDHCGRAASIRRSRR